MFQPTSHPESATPTTFVSIIDAVEQTIETRLVLNLADRHDPDRLAALDDYAEAQTTADNLAERYIFNILPKGDGPPNKVIATQILHLLRIDSQTTDDFINIFSAAMKAAMSVPQGSKASGKLMHALVIIDTLIALKVAERDAFAAHKRLH